jgi:hypothetical protein
VCGNQQQQESALQTQSLSQSGGAPCQRVPMGTVIDDDRRRRGARE